MIKFVEKLKNTNPDLVSAVRDFVKYNKTDIQIVAAKGETLEHLVKQGGDLKEVNEARKSAGLWPIESNTNKQLLNESFVDSIQKGKGVVFLLVNGEKRRKVDAQIQNQINWTLEKHNSIFCEIVKNDSFDSLFFSIKGKQKKNVEQLSENLSIAESEPSKNDGNE